MLDSIKENWIYVAVLAVLLVALVIIWRFAFKSMNKTSQSRKELMARLERMKGLSERYSTLVACELTDIPDEDLFDAAVIRIWKKLGGEKEEMENFAALTPFEKYIYTAWYLRDENRNGGLSGFFRNCGHVLSELASIVCAQLGLNELDAVMKEACEMFDKKSSVSCDRESVEKIQQKFNAVYNDSAYCTAAASFIRAHAESFTDPESVLVPMDICDDDGESER